MRFNQYQHIRGNKFAYFDQHSNQWNNGKPTENEFNTNDWNVIVTESHISYFTKSKISFTKILYDQNGYASLSTDLNPNILILSETGYQRMHYTSEFQRNKAIIGYIGGKWFPAATPNVINKILKENSFIDMNERVVTVFLKELLNQTNSDPSVFQIYEAKIKNYRRPQDKTLLALETIQKIIKERFQELEQNDFYLYFPINYQDVKSKQLQLLNEYYSNPYQDDQYLSKIRSSQSILQALKNQNNDIVNILKLDVDSQKVTIISEEEKNQIISNSKTSKTSNNNDFEIQKSDIEFNPNATYFKDVNEPLGIYKRLKDACKECKSFPIALYRYMDMEISDEGVREFNSLFNIYNWATNENTLKNSSFISLIRDYNIAFTSLVRTLIDSGVQLSPELQKIAGHIPNVVELPHQEIFSVDYMKKEWENKKALNLQTTPRKNQIFNLPPPKEKEDKKNNDILMNKQNFKKQNNNQVYKSQNRTIAVQTPQTLDDLKDWLLNNLSQRIDIKRGKFKTKIPTFKDLTAQNLNIQPFIDAALPLVVNLVNELKKKETQKFSNTDVVLLMDLSNTISKEQRIYLFTTFCAYAIALSILKIKTNYTVFADANLQMTIKDFNDDFSLSSLQKVLDTFSVNRQVSNLYFAIDYLNECIPQSSIDFKSKRSIFVFSDGLFVNMLPSLWIEGNILDQKQSTKLQCIFLSNMAKNDLDRMIHPYQELKNAIPHFEFIMLNSSHLNDSNIDFYTNNMKILIGAFLTCLQESPPVLYQKKEIKVNAPETLVLVKKQISLETFDSEPDVYFINQKDNQAPIDICRLPTVDLPECDEFIVRIKKENLQKLFSNEDFELSYNNISDLSSLFEPNKPSQATPSEKGYGISLLGLIRCTITNGQDKRIYLEKNAGFVSSYSCFIVVDCNSSVCSIISLQHSIQTIVILMKAISKIDNVRFSLILATKDGPVELCLNKFIEDILGDDSQVILALREYMDKPGIKTSVADALNAVNAIRSTQSEKESICFVFTDAEYSKEENIEVNSIITALNILKTEVIGVGLGLSPIRIDELFSMSIWSSNPNKIANVLGQLLKHQKNSDINNLMTIANNENVNFEACLEMIQKEPVFTDLIDAMGKFTVSLSSTQIYVNNISSVIYEKKQRKSGEITYDDNTSLLPDDIDKNEEYDLGQGKKWPLNILICQFWDAQMVEKGKENELITYQTLVGKNGIVQALQSLGIKVHITQNYRESIAAVCSGYYHQVWIICGRGDKHKPTTRPKSNIPPTCKNLKTIYPLVQEDYKLAIAFIDNVISFRERGGGVAFWADAHFTYELDYFLERVQLQYGLENNSIKKPVELKFNLIDPSKDTILEPGKIAQTTKSGKTIFTMKPRTFDNRDYYTVETRKRSFERRLYSFNVSDLYEGDSIACAQADSKIYPFYPFSYSTMGYISGAYYMAPVDSNEGDIIIDGAASRLFIELNKCGIRRLVRNMAVWLESFERRSLKLKPEQILKIKPLLVNPVNYPSEIPKYYTPRAKMIEIVFVFDSTKSTKPIARTLRNIVEDLKTFVQEKYNSKNVRIALVSFKDYAMARLIHQKYEQEQFAKNVKQRNKGQSFPFIPINEFQSVIFKQIKICGGCGDGPEDWVDAFNRVNLLNWSKDSRKIIIMLTDQGGHGINYHNPISTKFQQLTSDEIDQIDQQEQGKIIPNLKQFANKDIDIIFLGSTSAAHTGYQALQRDYTQFVDENHLSYHRVNFKNDSNEFRKALSDKINTTVEEFFMADTETFVRRKINSEKIGFDDDKDYDLDEEEEDIVDNEF